MLYHPLELSENQIRLLILRDTGGDLIGELVHVSLDKPPAYSALSYTWGSNIKDRYIQCSFGNEQGIIASTAGLETALKVLHLEHKIN